MLNILSRRNKAPTVPGLLTTHRGYVFLPGAMNVVYDFQYSKRPVPLAGAGIWQYSGFSPRQAPPQVYVSPGGPQIPIAGPGIVTGGFYGAPLVGF